MKPLVRDFLVCGGVALLDATGMRLVLSWIATLPRIGFVPMPAVCERLNTATTFVVVFAIVFTPAMVFALLRELRRRLDA